MVLSVITPTIRLDGAIEAAKSIQRARSRSPHVDVRHIIAYWPGTPNWSRERVAPWFSEIIRTCAPGWIIIVDDDNRMHPEFIFTLDRVSQEKPQIQAFLFAMEYPQFPGGVLMPQLPPTPGHIDGGQVAIRQEYACLEPWPLGGYGDGWYWRNLYNRDPALWDVSPLVTTYYNHQRRVPPLVNL